MIPEKIDIPLKTESPKWRLSHRDWIAPGLVFLTSFVMYMIDQALNAITTGGDVSWTVIVVVPLLMVLKKFVTEGTRQNPESIQAKDTPKDREWY